MQPLDTDTRERSAARAESSPLSAEAPVSAGEAFTLTPPHNPGQMRVTKRNGRQEVVDVNKIVRAVTRSAEGLHAVDPMRVALKTIGGLYDGATTQELDQLSIRTAAALTAEEPEYGQLAARLLGAFVDKEVSGQEIQSFSQSIARGAELGILNDRLRDFVSANSRKLNDAIDPLATRRFEYFGLRTVYDRYLLRHPQLRKVLETPQHFFMRIACALGGNEIGETLELYRLLSSLEYIASSPTLFNAGTAHEQLSSCFLLDSPLDSLESIYEKYGDVAKLSKFAGGIGLAYSRVRSRGSLIKGTNGHSNGLVPWLKTLDASVAAVNQGGKRKGAACVYLEPWHGDIEEFLELRDNTGDEARRTHNLNLANWIPDEFMRRVESDGEWSLFDPKVVPHFVDSWGETFEKAYREAEAAGLAVKKVKARELYARMLRTLAQTGNGWMTFKDRSNATSNQTGKAENVIHLSNLCTEILEVTNADETAVCNLGSINLARHVVDGRFDFDKLAATARTAVRQLDRVIDLNFYPIATAKVANNKWRPVGLGVMGLQDVFFKLRLPFDSTEALELSTRIAEEIYYNALSQSNELAMEFGAHPGFAESRAANGELQFDYWTNAKPSDQARWDALRESIKAKGLRNSLLIAIAPTATIASIAGCYECIEPQVSNLFKRETLSGDFLVVNRYLVEELKTLGLWTADVRDAIKLAEGSIQGIAAIPERLRTIYRTVWELPQKALIDLGAARGAYIDQSQSLNLFMENPNIGQLSSMYMYAWKSGIKTTYYLRSRPATKIAKTTVSATAVAKPAPASDQEQATAAVFCSLENPEYCEACQ
ncbi:ribonucleoside-diphosphate reductase subunit alpha [Rhodanobacter sp. 7MK24]|uniref:ribonucleoside-diphosphate reductase subunit alpha n=1 Tax=Rhodanobacter sp. 7MK24 TaxID=2775922 RepID=UPI0017820803|nr:ribonucleoside-diphosphate reductase subunit alpha [Rhodanobacter sp. 7MK24]MBD8880009.1 ribonucleoside-diphosphate reductase subunit alpha [Rhodanobacter sp. 7MK24]